MLPNFPNTNPHGSHPFAVQNTQHIMQSKFCCRCPEFSLGGADEPVVLDVQLEFLTALIISELKDNDVIYSTEGHVTLQQDLQVDLDQLNARPDNVFYKTRFTPQKVAFGDVISIKSLVFFRI